MSTLTHKLFGIYMNVENGAEAVGTGGAADRGDVFTLPTDELGAGDNATGVADSINATDDKIATDDKGATDGKSSTDDGQSRDAKGRFIPKSRFDEALTKERTRAEAAERRLAELQAQLRQVDRHADVAKIEEELKGMEKQHAKFLLDGDHEKAADVMGQIRLKERQIAIQEATHLSAQAKEQAREEIRVETTVERLQEAYPQLNEAHEEFDQELVNYVLAEQRRLIEDERMSPSKALLKAANDIMRRLTPSKSVDGAGSKGLAGAQKTADRTAAAVVKNVDAAKRQPPDTKDVGLDSDKAGIRQEIDVSKLSFSEFEALPEATKARLRGDLL